MSRLLDDLEDEDIDLHGFLRLAQKLAAKPNRMAPKNPMPPRPRPIVWIDRAWESFRFIVRLIASMFTPRLR